MVVLKFCRSAQTPCVSMKRRHSLCLHEFNSDFFFHFKPNKLMGRSQTMQAVVCVSMRRFPAALRSLEQCRVTQTYHVNTFAPTFRHHIYFSFYSFDVSAEYKIKCNASCPDAIRMDCLFSSVWCVPGARASLFNVEHIWLPYENMTFDQRSEKILRSPGSGQ